MEPTNDINQQISAVESLIAAKVNVIVMLPNDGAQLNQIARSATDAGIPVVNLDRIFPDKLSYRTYIGGDNYGMGVAAGHYIGKKLKDAGTANPVILEIQGIATLPLTQDRSKGFEDALKSYGFSVTAKQDAQFTVESGTEVAANLLQAHPKVDAIWNHDDDQGIGVLAAIKEANRSEFFMVGGAGSANAMRDIQADSGVLKATVTYSPTMAASAIKLARLIAQGKGMSDLLEHQVPQSITLASGDHHEGERRRVPAAGLRVVKPVIGVGMVGYAFMGRVHSQAWRSVGAFFDLPVKPSMAVLSGRSLADAAGRCRTDGLGVRRDGLEGTRQARRRAFGRHLHAR